MSMNSHPDFRILPILAVCEDRLHFPATEVRELLTTGSVFCSIGLGYIWKNKLPTQKESNFLFYIHRFMKRTYYSCLYVLQSHFLCIVF